MRENKEIVAIIKSLMNDRNLSLSELARRTGMAKSTISRYLNESREFPLNKADDFARVLKVTPEYLLGFEEEYQPTTIAAHLDGEVSDLDEDEMQKVLEYVKFLKSQQGK
ncbi:helix-turn-helix domain-containing protein [Mammaliicoccus sciuri]|uniref:helix-turn-helix domain-containing protein n=1 Tax=Mammaliicoccus sciuri TaxID=1296 RepID=UPI001950D531|nr:helix-turn-helix transcriptional regulator [Mammaliicoccus sciuri]MCD8798649.1 helix-turn-helix domain-containing protein [Mammaliicoccus sciuri]MEB8131510.1 helix-turn-helix domain-containing protein [Mammaliicoccus sciuri]